MDTNSYFVFPFQYFNWNICAEARAPWIPRNF